MYISTTDQEMQSVHFDRKADHVCELWNMTRNNITIFQNTAIKIWNMLDLWHLMFLTNIILCSSPFILRMKSIIVNAFTHSCEAVNIFINNHFYLVNTDSHKFSLIHLSEISLIVFLWYNDILTNKDQQYQILSSISTCVLVILSRLYFH